MKYFFFIKIYKLYSNLYIYKKFFVKFLSRESLELEIGEDSTLKAFGGKRKEGKC